MHFKSASDLRELEILERRKIHAAEAEYGDDEEEDEEDDDRFHSGSSSGLGYSERSPRSQAASTDDLVGKADYRRLMASGLVSSSVSTSRLSRSQSILATTTTPSPTTSVFTRKRRQLPKCPEEEFGVPPPPQQSHVGRQQSMLEGTTRERLEKMTRNRMLRDQILQDQMSQAAASPVVPDLPLEGEPPLQGRRLHAVSRKLSRRRSFLEKARETIRTAKTAAASASVVEPLPGMRSRPSLARRTSFLESKPVRKMAKLARR